MPSNMMLIIVSCALLCSLIALAWTGYRLREAGFDLFDERFRLYFDGEAGMDNRRRLSWKLNTDHRRVTAVAIVSMYGLADIRRVYGHRTASAVLGHLTWRRTSVRVCGAAFYRLSTDEIAVVWTGPANTSELWQLCEALRQPIWLSVAGQDTAFIVSVAAGICAVEATDSEQVILSRADTALQAAIAKGPGHVVAWSDDLPARSRVRHHTPVCAVVEFNPTLPPEVVVGPSRDLVARQVVRVLAVRAVAQLGNLDSDVAGPDAGIALPDPDDFNVDILRWLDEFRSSATRPSVTWLGTASLHHAGQHPGPVELTARSR